MTQFRPDFGQITLWTTVDHCRPQCRPHCGHWPSSLFHSLAFRFSVITVPLFLMAIWVIFAHMRLIWVLKVLLERFKVSRNQPNSAKPAKSAIKSSQAQRISAQCLNSYVQFRLALEMNHGKRGLITLVCIDFGSDKRTGMLSEPYTDLGGSRIEYSIQVCKCFGSFEANYANQVFIVATFVAIYGLVCAVVQGYQRFPPHKAFLWVNKTVLEG